MTSRQKFKVREVHCICNNYTTLNNFNFFTLATKDLAVPEIYSTTLVYNYLMKMTSRNSCACATHYATHLLRRNITACSVLFMQQFTLLNGHSSKLLIFRCLNLLSFTSCLTHRRTELKLW